MPSDVTVKLDDRLRLMSALLAASDYPQTAQARHPHGVHTHARATEKRLAALSQHEAVITLQTLLKQGAPLEALYTMALALRMPDLTIDKPPRWMPAGWDAQIRDFAARADLAQWWLQEKSAWEKALGDCANLFEQVQLKPMLKPFLGDITEQLVFIPNLSFPTDLEMGLRTQGALICICPPWLAWGTNPPWPFDEDPSHAYRAALKVYARLIMSTHLAAHKEKVAEASSEILPVSDAFKARYRTWGDQFIELFASGVVAMFLNQQMSKADADAFEVMERKAHGMLILPAVIQVLRRYRQDAEAGKSQDLADFLPVFARQLRVAKRFVSL